MLTDCAVALSTSPICSAICMNRLLKISIRAADRLVAHRLKRDNGRFQHQFAVVETARGPAALQHDC